MRVNSETPNMTENRLPFKCDKKSARHKSENALLFFSRTPVLPNKERGGVRDRERQTDRERKRERIWSLFLVSGDWADKTPKSSRVI